MNALFDLNAPAWIWGAPGIGKSESVYQVASARAAAAGHDAHVTDIRLSTFDPVPAPAPPPPGMTRM
ncbi:hypothetical protein [Mesorhizobium silamurunense]|uniref:hypothetical protein n=1 Tax=Mesorhizobium silamurunense TaxID=499528 RepID=UPI001784A5AC|nr:hypothetical protein [Mesorhizobium silamurunense]